MTRNKNIWEYPYYDGTKCRLELVENGLRLTRGTTERIFGFNEIWNEHFSGAPVGIAQSALVAAAAVCDFDSLPEKAKKYAAFYRSFRVGDVKGFAIEFIDDAAVPIWLTECALADDGCFYYHAYTENARENRRLSNSQTAAQFFFHGPAVPNMPFRARRQMRQTLFDLTLPNGLLRESDGFPIIDYNRVATEKWQWDTEDGGGGFIELESDRVSSGGWNRAGDGGGSDQSLENYYTQLIPLNYVDPIRDRILERLKYAILTEDEINAVV